MAESGAEAVRNLFADPAAILRAVVAAEVLGPPVAFLGESDPPGASPPAN